MPLGDPTDVVQGFGFQGFSNIDVWLRKGGIGVKLTPPLSFFLDCYLPNIQRNINDLNPNAR
jgi:hypothetical protein